MRKSTQSRIITTTGVFASTLFVSAAAVYVFAPAFKSSADTVNVKADVGSSISLSLDKSELNLNGNANTFVYGYATASVSTNSNYGYTLAMEDADSVTDLVSAISDDKFTSTFVGTKTQATMENNNWGYSLNEIDFYKIPVKNSPVALKRVSSYLETEIDSTTVSIGAKIGPDITSGQYQDQLLFSAYVNGVDGNPEGVDPNSNPPADPGEESVGTLSGNMQDFDCSEAEIGEFGRLTDNRDYANNKYTVAKLADGNCWMTQNLRIAGVTLTSADSDVSSNFTIPAAVTTPTGWSYTRTNPVIFDTQDASYGMYYNHVAASAGTVTGNSTSIGTTNNSVCPKGWRIPTRPMWLSMLGAYSVTDDAAGVEVAMSSPINLVFGGSIGNDTYNRGEGVYGGYWTATNTTSSQWTWAVSLSATSISVNASTDRQFAYPIRCIAR